MVGNHRELKEILQYEDLAYSDYMFQSKSKRILAAVKQSPIFKIYKFQRISRKSDFYRYKVEINKNIFYYLLYLYFVRKRNILGRKLGLEVGTYNTQKGLLMFHFNNVINDKSVIGKNCHLHGNNCIGNDGKTDDCPIIGDNVSLGVGAKVIGNITIANNIKIGAGAVVIHSFLEENITIGGIPAKKLK